jgi:hypothetical protein
MDQEFVTSMGKVMLNNQRVLIKDLKFNFWKTALGEIALPASIIAFAFFGYFSPTKPLGYVVSAVFVALFFSTSFKHLYAAVVKKSYSAYIPVNRIKSFELKPDEFGLETELRLHLKNGRHRSIVFRTLEKQYEPVAEQLSQYLVQLEFA